MLQQSSDFVLTIDERKRVREFVRKHGEATASVLLGVSRPTLGRVLAGLPARRGTLFAVRAKLGATP